jgi:heterodisulfide reductase subunit B
MEYFYFPGCTLNTKAKNLDLSARECSRILGLSLEDLPDWTCCGATFPLAADSTMGFIPPARMLGRAAEGGKPLLTLCSICYNVLKRTNHLIARDAVVRDRLNNHIERDYQGTTRVVHLLEVLRDDLGFDALASKVVLPLRGLRLAAYYGCMLLRPAAEMAFDDKENPSVFENFVRSMGAEVVDFPFRNECCGSYQSVGNPDVAEGCARRILDSASRNGADALVTTCPLCAFNLDHRQQEIRLRDPSFHGLPVLYLTQALGLALGLPADRLGFERNYISPLPLLEEKGLLPAGAPR